MNIRLRAAVRTASVFVFGLLGGLFAYAVFQLEPAIIVILMLGILFAWMIYLVYSISLRNLEDMDAIDKLIEQSEARLAKYSTKGEK